MNTRLQVEHPVTEVTGADVDLVQWQIRIARGERLDSIRDAPWPWPRHRVPHLRRRPGPEFHAIARPDSRLATTSGPGIRDDGVAAGYTVPVYYDSMIAKLIAWGVSCSAAASATASRDVAIARMSRALRECRPRHPDHDSFLPVADAAARLPARAVSTTYLDRLLVERRGESFGTFTDEESERIAIAAAVDAYRRAAPAATARGRRAALDQPRPAGRPPAVTAEIEVAGRTSPRSRSSAWTAGVTGRHRRGAARRRSGPVRRVQPPAADGNIRWR